MTGPLRGAFLALLVAGTPAGAFEAAYEAPTTRYPHGVLGDRIEYGTLVLRGEGGEWRVTLPETRVFEDIAPRVVELDGDPGPEVLVVEADLERGAALVAYEPGAEGTLIRRGATRHIGRRFRWLSPAGVADFDGDGRPDVAYVETPHLGKTLRFVTLEGARFVEIASAGGFS
ncbi:MAG: VCBS repeat-containing protein, partial [Pseudomonadota bacterium]